MRKRYFLIAGIVLLVLGLALLVALQIFASLGEDKSRETVEKMAALLPQRSQGVVGMYSDLNMPILEIDGEDYVAMLEIPSFSITLPVANQWDRNELFDSPARFYGSCYDQSLVIGGVDRSYQFSFCDKIENGALIIVTDMTGAQFRYEVTCVERSDRAESQWLIGGDHGLTLFCRDTYSMEYIAVRCALAY